MGHTLKGRGLACTKRHDIAVALKVCMQTAAAQRVFKFITANFAAWQANAWVACFEFIDR